MKYPRGLWGWTRDLFWSAAEERRYSMERAQLAMLALARRTGATITFSSEAAHLTDPATGEQITYDLGPLDPEWYEEWLLDLIRRRAG